MPAGQRPRTNLQPPRSATAAGISLTQRRCRLSGRGHSSELNSAHVFSAGMTRRIPNATRFHPTYDMESAEDFYWHCQRSEIQLSLLAPSPGFWMRQPKAGTARRRVTRNNRLAQHTKYVSTDNAPSGRGAVTWLISRSLPCPGTVPASSARRDWRERRGAGAHACSLSSALRGRSGRNKHAARCAR